MPDDLTQSVINCIAEAQHLDPEKITLDSTFEELGIDSLDGINVLFALETDFDIIIPDEAAQNIRGVREMVEGVRKLVAEKSVSDSSSQS
jgi:acyl carrier protein